MAKTKTPSFVLTLKLNTSPSDERELARRFYNANQMHNKLVKHARKALSSLRQDKACRALMKERFSLSGKNDPVSKRRRADIGRQLSELRLDYGLSEYQFHAWIKVQQHRYARTIDSHTAQKIATGAWRAVESVLYRKGKSVRFKKLEDLTSLEGKTNASGIRFSGGRLRWLGLVIQPQLRKGDVYARQALRHRVKYCRIKRMAVGSSWDYYLQLVLEGTPPKKHAFRDGFVGLDQGTSSEAVFSEEGCILTELAPERRDISREAARLQRKMDRSRRATNPDRYAPDGTVKRTRRPWKRSGAYRKAHFRLKALRRRNADFVRQEEERLANVVLTKHGSDIITEPMDYRALQRRSRQDRLTKTGRHRSKKRFGASLAVHAPGRFRGILERKLSYEGKTISYVDQWKYRASQYDHTTGEYTKPRLGDRTKTIGGRLVQRDLYSAFLLYCAKDTVTIDRALCEAMFPVFLKHHDSCIAGLMGLNRALSSFGLKDFAV